MLFASGFPDLLASGPRASALEHRLLSKPYRRDELAVAVRETLDQDSGDSGPRPGIASGLATGVAEKN